MTVPKVIIQLSRWPVRCDCRLINRTGAGFFLRAESFFNVATRIDALDKEPAFAPPLNDSYGGQSLHTRSHGETFLTLLDAKFRRNGLFLLDEPEAALSPQRQLAFWF